jgi:hypothetical protein
LESFSKGGLDLDKYIQLRKNEVPNIEDLIGVARTLENRPRLNKELAAVLTEIERNILKKIV